MDEPKTIEDAERRMDEIAEELARGVSKSKGKSIIELRKLCGKHRTVPTSYKLKGVEKEGEYAQYISKTIEIWRGRYKGEVVALKIVRLSRGDPSMQRIEGRLCKEVVLMKQLEHKNILPFYGVMTTDSEFRLVFPWYDSGNIMEYLKKNPDINQFELLSDAASGLRFLHANRLVHGCLRPGHILIDDSGAAQLATGGRSSVVATPGTSIAGHVQSVVDGANVSDDSRYTEPEILSLDESHAGNADTIPATKEGGTGNTDGTLATKEGGAGNADRILATKEGDVYGMGMVVYEALTGNVPYFGWNDPDVLEKIRVGELPRRPSGINGTVWEFLQKCWSRDPTKRPSIVQVCDAFSEFCLLPKFTLSPDAWSATELPGRVKLMFKSIKVPSEKSKQPFFVKLQYGSKVQEHTTPPTKLFDTSSGHTWSGTESWSFDTDRRYHGQTISVELTLRAGWRKKDKLYATGKFSLINNVNTQTNVKLEATDSGGSAILQVLLTAM